MGVLEKQNWYYRDLLEKFKNSVGRDGELLETLKSYHKGTAMNIFTFIFIYIKKIVE